MEVIGIDLGTTYSAVARVDENGVPTVVDNIEGAPLTPSAVAFDPDGSRCYVGAEAKEMLDDGNENVAVFFKRRMGQPDSLFTVGARSFEPHELSALLLKGLVNGAGEVLGREIDAAVITVPAYYGNAERTAVMKAAELAGIRLLALCNEPTAAALAYGVTNKLDGIYMVYDLGGGTFDVSVVSVADEGKAITVLATTGDHHLGGKDWDDMIVAHASQLFLEKFGDDIADDPEAYNMLVYNAERMKKQLSQRQATYFNISFGGNVMRFEITRDEFEQFTAHLLESTIAKAEEALGMASLSWSDLSGVLLVGGSTKMPAVARFIAERTGRQPLHGVNPDEAVALGAAVLAAMECDKGGLCEALPAQRRSSYGLAGAMRLTDVMSHSLGAVAVSADGSRYVNSIIIPRNKPIPATEVRQFEHSTSPRTDNALEIYVTQGETPELATCVFDACYAVPRIDHAPGGKVLIDIAYSYDANGVINVTAGDHASGRLFPLERRPLPADMSWIYERPGSRGGGWGSGQLNVCLLIDESGSMAGKAIEKAVEAAREFVAQCAPDVRIAVCGFTSKVSVHCSLTDDRRSIEKAIAKLDARFAGNGYDGLADCYQMLRKEKGKGVIVVLTDGEWFAGNAPYATSDKCRKEHIDIIALGFGSADRKFLERIATISVMTDLGLLTSNFSNIARELSSGTDVRDIQLR